MKPVDRLNRALNALALELPERVHSHARGEIMAAFDAAVFDERVACARVAEDEWAQTSGTGTPDFLAYQKACHRIAKAIRARNPEGV